MEQKIKNYRLAIMIIAALQILLFVANMVIAIKKH